MNAFSPQFRNMLSAALLTLVLALQVGCVPQTPNAAVDSLPDASPDSRRTEDMSWGQVQLILSTEPAEVHLEQDLLLTVELHHPAHLKVELPPLEDRLEGFLLAGSYGGEPIEDGAQVTRRIHYRLTPTLAKRHRIAPMAVTYTDTTRYPPQPSWFATRPLVFDSADLMAVDAVPDAPTVALEPYWVPLAVRDILIVVALVLAVLALLALLIWLLSRLQHQVKLMRMSPRERALTELRKLLSRHLIQKDEYKEFYLQLTMIVRRYIERAHRVRAPEQTTEEFLSAARKHPDFTAETVGKLERFLQAADLVKFAGVQPGTETADAATLTARDYIETDARVSRPRQEET